MDEKREKVNYKLKKRIYKSREEWVYVENTHEAIISEVEFRTVQDLLKYDGRKSEDSDCASLFIGILTCGDCRTPMIRKKKGLLLEGYHAGYCTREGYLEGGRELEQRISGLEQRRARIRDDMAECEKLPESERKGQEFLQLSEPDLGGVW